MTQEAKLWEFVREYDSTLTELPEAFAFGDSPEMADRLLSIVLSGQKTATTGWPLDPTVQPNTLSIVLDGSGQPKALIRVVRVDLMPFLEVSAAHAKAEGEGDLTLEWWRTAHRRFFMRQEAERPFTDDEIVQCETFEVVWPKN